MADDENACVRNIVKEIIRECIPKNIKVNKNFLTYLTKLLLIDPNWGIGDDFFNQRQNVQYFVKYVIETLMPKQEEPEMVTLRIQFFFQCNMEHMDHVIELNRADLKKKLRTLKEDICFIRDIESKEDLDTITKKIIIYITLMSGLGNPSKPKVYEEALAALRSVLDEDEIREFVDFSKHEKHQRLEQLFKIVAGIRLFNKDCDKGGEGIANLPVLLDKATSVIIQGTEQTLLIIMERVNMLTTAVEKVYFLTKIHNGHIMEFKPPDFFKTAHIESTKDMLIFFRQYELIIRQILEELARIRENGNKILSNMQTLLKEIHETVYMKIAIPVGVVFPLFEQLWDIWEQFQNQSFLLSRLSVIMFNLEGYSNKTHFDFLIIDHIIGSSSSLTDAERLAHSSHLKLNSINSEVSVLSTRFIKNLDHLKLEYLGFCCWKLIETDGALIPGNPSMGVVKYRRRYYVFSCVEAFNEFCKDPQMYVHSVLALARRKPQLITFFQLKEDLESVYSIEKLVKSKVEIKICEDKSIQTISHLEERHINPKYKWNVWDLKRQALTMAKISNDKTVSTQTNKTSSKNSIRSQTYYTKPVAVQTTRENYTNVPKPSVFLYGLRGRKDNQQFKIDLTRPVNEG